MEQKLESRYLIREQIGQGAFGVIYHALDEKNHREIAIKVWKAGSETEIFSHDNSPFLREERISGVVKIYDYFEKAGMNFLVMEYLPGGTLKQKMEALRKQNSQRQLLELFRPVLEGLAFLHSEGLVHCDLSPDNLMFDEAGNLKLIDLGACRGKEIICDKKFMKEAYSAPEQYTAPDRIGPWTDVYGICAVLFETLTGEKPISSVQRIQKEEFRPVSFYTKIDRHIDRAIFQGLNLDIQQRYFSMEFLLHALGYDTDSIRMLSGSTRYFWGQKWIQISGFGMGYHVEGRKQNHRILSRIGLGALCTALAAGGFWAGDQWLQKYYPVQYFERKARKAKEQGVAKNDERLISSLDEDYETILKKLEKYDPKIGEDLTEGMVSCELTEDELLEWNIPGNTRRKMYLDKDSIQKVLFSQMGLDRIKNQIKTEKNSYPSVYRKVDDSYELLSNLSYSEEAYQVTTLSGDTENYKILYDPVDQRVICLRGITTDPQRFRTFVETLLPVCCPEAYLTSEEIEGLQKQMEESKEGRYIQVNHHSWLSIMGSVNESQQPVEYSVAIAASNDGILY